MEQRLIDANALKAKKTYSHERHEYIVPVAEIDWMPTVDAVPVTRCRECKYYLPWDDATYGNCKVGSGARMKDWYCNLGGRKEKTDEQED